MIRLIALILLILLFAQCRHQTNEPAIYGEDTTQEAQNPLIPNRSFSYTIFQGFHESWPLVLYNARSLDIRFSFKMDTAIYSADRLLQQQNPPFTSKIFGFILGLNPHHTSLRLVWRTHPISGLVELYHYEYVSRTRSMVRLGSYRRNELDSLQFRLHIDTIPINGVLQPVFRSEVFKAGQSTAFYTGKNRIFSNSTFRRTLRPYYGGNLPAPITFQTEITPY